MEHLAPLIGMAAQPAIHDRTEALAIDVLHDAARSLNPPTPDRHDTTW